jgi:hypothetical protein
LPLLSKRAVADRVLDRVAAALDERDAAVQTGASTNDASGAAGTASSASPRRAAG